MAKVVERGFFYSPRIGHELPAGREDIQRLYLILSPDNGGKRRLIGIGHKKIPEIVPVSRTDLLDHKNVQILLIGARCDVEKELAIKLHPEKETAASAEMFKDLKLDRETHPVRPLFKGEWQ